MKKFDNDFNEWLLSKEMKAMGVNDQTLVESLYHPTWFYQLPKSMQWGVYVDFFLNKGHYAYILQDISGGFFGAIRIGFCTDSFKTLKEAQEETLKKAIEIYNK